MVVLIGRQLYPKKRLTLGLIHPSRRLRNIEGKELGPRDLILQMQKLKYRELTTKKYPIPQGLLTLRGMYSYRKTNNLFVELVTWNIYFFPIILSFTEFHSSSFKSRNKSQESLSDIWPIKYCWHLLFKFYTFFIYFFQIKYIQLYLYIQV